MLKVALVGVGGVSWAHLQAWESMSDVELAALCDPPVTKSAFNHRLKKLIALAEK